MPPSSSLLILLAGPSLAGSEPAALVANQQASHAAAAALLQAGHCPVSSEWLSSPLMPHAGSPDDETARSQAQQQYLNTLLQRCDGVLRVAGQCPRADHLVEQARQRGLPVYHHVHEIAAALRN